MAYNYQSWSVVFGEQPSASKWNMLGTNDASFDERIGDNFSAGTTSPIWSEELKRTTLGGANDTITVSPIPARKYIEVRFNLINTGQLNPNLSFNGDSGTNYAIRVSEDGAGDSTAVSQTAVNLFGAISASISGKINITNVGSIPKLGNTMSMHYGAGTSGANAPRRRDLIVKWGNTSDQITRIDITNGGTGDFATGSEVIVSGHD